MSRNAHTLTAEIVRLLNAAFIWTRNDQGGVAQVCLVKAHKFTINIDGREFEVTVKEITP